MNLLVQGTKVLFLKTVMQIFLEAWQLVECGPGSGTLMKDILSVLHKFGVSFFYHDRFEILGKSGFCSSRRNVRCINRKARTYNMCRQ